MSFEDWSPVADENTSVGGVNIAEGMYPSGVNNAIRAVMAELTVLPKPFATIADLRANSKAFTSGRVEVQGYHSAGDGAGGSFSLDPSDTTSADNGGTIIVDAAGRRWKRATDNVVTPEMFGAKRDGVTDDTAAIQAAYDAAPGSVQLMAGTYGITDTITCSHKTLIGSAQSTTALKALAPMGPMLRCIGRLRVQDILLAGDGKATELVSVSSGNGSILSGVRGSAARYDGIRYEASGNNNNATVDRCWIQGCGTELALTGTASAATSGDNSIITFTGGADLTTLGIRLRKDRLWVPGHVRSYEVNGVTANTLTVYPVLAGSITGEAMTVCQGSGVMIERHGDNNRITVKSSTLNGNKVAGLHDKGLYGAISESNTMEFNTVGRIIGNRGSGSETVFDPSEAFIYYEGNRDVDVLYAFAARNVVNIGGSGLYSKRVYSGSASPTELGTTERSIIAASGISFPTVAVLSTNAKVLDDYEEGSWTPVIIGTTDSGAGTYTTRVGRYTKIGNRVTLDVHIAWTAHTGTGNMRVGGLPYASTATASYRASAAIGSTHNLALTAGNFLSGLVENGVDYVSLWQGPPGGGAASAVPIDTAATLMFTVSYQV